MALATTSQVLAEIKAEVVAPQGQTLLTDSDLLRIVQKQLLQMESKIRSAQENYSIEAADFTIGTTNGFAIPHRAMGNAINSVCFVDAQGQESDPLFPDQGGVARNSSFSPYGSASYFIRKNKVYLTSFPAGSSYPTLRILYYPHPGDLVLDTTSAATVTLATPTTVTLSQNYGVSGATTVDFISQNSPFNLLASDISASISTTTMTIAGGVPADVVTGAWVCTAQYSPIPQLPYALFPALVYFSKAAVLDSYGDSSAMQRNMASGQEVLKDYLSLVKPRVQTNLRYLGSQNKFKNGYWRFPLSQR